MNNQYRTNLGFIVMLLLLTQTGSATTYNVNPGESIQVAINGATYGDTVAVAAGTYHERITLKNGVRIIGAGASLIILDSQSAGTVVTAIDCDSNTLLEGFTITNGLGNMGGGMVKHTMIFYGELIVSG